jgi:hypothetical protein
VGFGTSVGLGGSVALAGAWVGCAGACVAVGAGDPHAAKTSRMLSSNTPKNINFFDITFLLNASVQLAAGKTLSIDFLAQHLLVMI